MRQLDEMNPEEALCASSSFLPVAYATLPCMLLKEIFAIHASLFPEEWYLTQGDALTIGDEPADAFAQQYAAHLSFYGAHLAPQLTERSMKAALNIAYHLANGEPLSVPDRDIAVDLLSEENEQQHSHIALYLAQTDLRAALSAHDAQFPTHVPTPLPARAAAQMPTQFVNPVQDWTTWMQSLYGISPLSQYELEAEARALLALLKSLPPSQKMPLANRPTAEIAAQFEQILGDVLDMHVPDASIVPLPHYLRSMIPSAAAYSFNRFTKPQRVTLLNMDAPWSVPHLVLLMAHETYAHLWHFAQVDAHAPLSRRIPAMYRYACTEGVALLVEAHVATVAVAEVAERIGALLAIDPLALQNELRRTAHTLRLRRIGRALFEHHLYARKQSPLDALAAVLPFSVETADDLREDLFAFLPTPGYGSTYFHGYMKLLRVGASLDATWRERFGKFGFDIGGLAAA